MEHLGHEVNSIRIQLRDNMRQVLRLPLRELVPVAQLGHARPNVFGGRAKKFEDVKQLLQFRVTWKQGRLAGKLRCVERMRRVRYRAPTRITHRICIQLTTCLQGLSSACRQGAPLVPGTTA